jgi:hypothetical protein
VRLEERDRQLIEVKLAKDKQLIEIKAQLKEWTNTANSLINGKADFE